MKTLPLALLLLALPAFADEPAPWPQYRDTLYVAVKLEWMRGSIKQEVAPCVPLTLVKRKEDPSVFRTVDDMGRGVSLVGPGWSPFMHKTPEACASFVKEHPAPRVQTRDEFFAVANNGMGFRIIEPEPQH